MKRVTISKKKVEQIRDACSIHLDDVEEFEKHNKLFQEDPNSWTEFETNLCDYQMRLSNKIFQEVMKSILGDSYTPL